MFSRDEFLIAFSNQQAVNAPAGGPPLPIADRERLSLIIMNEHSREIVTYMDDAWELHNELRAGRIGSARSTSYTQGVIAAAMAAANEETYVDANGNPIVPGFGCLHLIYAFLIENTRTYAIFDRVLQNFNDGEKLGVATAQTRNWLNVTEALFYRQQRAHDHAPVSTLTSDFRADGEAIRRNAYYRMFGMDLNHGTDDNRPYPYNKPDASNRNFAATLEGLLRNLWVAITNVNNNNNVNPTDNAEIENLARILYIMLQNRRINGTITREEFSAVATLDWLRFTLSFNSPIVVDLRAQAESEFERLKKIAERVGLPCHGKSDEYFQLAGPMSALLQGIENQTLVDTGTFLAFPQIDNIINNWSKVTGKVLKTMPTPVVSQPAA